MAARYWEDETVAAAARCDPGLARSWQAVATGKGQTEPALAGPIRSAIFEGSPCADGHRIILRANQVNGRSLRGA